MKSKLSKIIVSLVLILGTVCFVGVVVRGLPDNINLISGRHKTATHTKKIKKPAKSKDSTYPINNDIKYIGVYAENPDDVTNVYNDSINTVGWYVDLNKNDAYEKKLSKAMDEHLYKAFITLEPSDMDLNDIANGVYDDCFIEFFSKLTSGKRKNTELFVRFAHEMEMRPTYLFPWYSWQSWDADAYIRAWQHVVDLSKEQGATNIKWVWSPNRADDFSKRYYPGDNYVDYVGLSLNNTTDSYDTFESFYASVGTKDALESYNKPIIISECAEHCLDETEKTQYIQSIFDYIEKDSNIVGAVFFDVNVDSERQYKFSDNSEQLNIFTKEAKRLTTTTKVGE